MVKLSTDKMKAISKKETIFEENILQGYGSLFFIISIEQTFEKKTSNLFGIFGHKELKKTPSFKKDEKEKLDKNYTGYEVNFYSVYTEKEMKEGFMKHLETEFNTRKFKLFKPRTI